jgi:hypothetical protein
MDIPKRRLGKTGIDVTILGLGGEGVLRTYGYEKDAYRSFPGRPAADVLQALTPPSSEGLLVSSLLP